MNERNSVGWTTIPTTFLRIMRFCRCQYHTFYHIHIVEMPVRERLSDYIIQRCNLLSAVTPYVLAGMTKGHAALRSIVCWASRSLKKCSFNIVQECLHTCIFQTRSKARTIKVLHTLRFSTTWPFNHWRYHVNIARMLRNHSKHHEAGRQANSYPIPSCQQRLSLPPHSYNNTMRCVQCTAYRCLGCRQQSCLARVLI